MPSSACKKKTVYMCAAKYQNIAEYPCIAEYPRVVASPCFSLLAHGFLFLDIVCNLTYPSFFFFNDTATTEIYTLSLHDALPILFNGEFTAGNQWVSPTHPYYQK